MAIGCILSLGTGWTNVPSLDKAKLHNVLAACVQIALDSEETAKRFMYDRRGEALWKHGKYFRFNVEQGMHDIELDEWKHLEKMDAMTTRYLSAKETAENIRSCAKSLLNPTSVSRMPPK
jgi:antirestriction protein